jgi:hypothetical protein
MPLFRVKAWQRKRQFASRRRRLFLSLSASETSSSPLPSLFWLAVYQICESGEEDGNLGRFLFFFGIGGGRRHCIADSMPQDEGGAGGGGFLFYKHFYVPLRRILCLR